MIYTSRRLKLLIKSLGITQREFAAMTGTSETAVSRYLEGTRVPNATTIIAITEATKVSPSWILGYGDDDKIERI